MAENEQNESCHSFLKIRPLTEESLIESYEKIEPLASSVVFF